MQRKKSAALEGIVGEDGELRGVLARAALVAPTATPVLITGESGTGKEALARSLHELGGNPGGPFVAVNCGALARELAESELFGHERGAFTGAAGRRRGWFEEASGGTLVLDEVGELPLDLQPKLLRVLETGRIRRVGGAGDAVVSVRVVAVTLRNLKAEAQRGAFRGDLYYRLAGFELELPPLRRRRGDIPLLVRHFLRELEPEIGAREIDAAALEALQRAEWPGNIRELRNAVRRAAILTGSRIDEAALELPPPPRFRIAESTMSPGPPRGPGPPAMGSDGEAVYARRDPHLRLAEVDPVPAPLPAADLFAEAVHAGAAGVTTHSVSLPGRTFEEIEREVLAWALRQNAGSRRRAARSLAIARSTFCDRVKKLNLA